MKKILLFSSLLTLMALQQVSAQKKGSSSTQKAGDSTVQSARTAKAATDTAKKDTLLNTIQGANDLKSGNWQDVLSSFAQLAADDLTGPNRSIKFQSTLFAIKSKADPSLLVDTNYVKAKQTFSRNFQFNFSLGVDSNFNLNGFSGGVTWAAINKRDTTLISFVGSATDAAFKKYAADYSVILFKFERGVVRDANDKVKPENKALEDSLTNALHPGLKPVPLPGRFIQFLKDQHYDDSSYRKVLLDYQDALARTRLRPLLTFSLNSAFGKSSRFDSARFDAAYLQGVNKKGRPLELDLRAAASLKDSLVDHDHYRGRISLTGGMNYALITSYDTSTKIYTPLVEIKPYAEYDGIFTARLPGEKQNVFYASMDIRVRITNALWLPITLKYDVNQKNLQGFLKLSLNLSAFKSQTAKKAS